jgi:hypothetical protein
MTNTKTTPKPIGQQWRGIFFEGPQSDQNADGDEIPVWFVFVGDEDSNPVLTVYQCHKFKSAEALARRMSRDRNLELISEAMPD